MENTNIETVMTELSEKISKATPEKKLEVQRFLEGYLAALEQTKTGAQSA